MKVSELWAWIVVGVLGALGVLYVMARQGDTVSIVILGVIAVLLFLLLGGGIVLLVMERMNNAEERRFRRNAQENLSLMAAQQAATLRQVQVQNAQLQAQARLNRDLVATNHQLTRAQQAEPDFGIDLDSLFGDDVIDADIDGNGRWAAR